MPKLYDIIDMGLTNEENRVFLRLAKGKMKIKLLAIICGLFLIFVLYKIIYLGKVLPNVYLAAVNLSGRDHQAVASYVDEKIQEFEESSILFGVENQKIEIPVKEMGIVFNGEQTTTAIIRFGRSDVLTKNILESVFAPFKKTVILPSYEIDYGKLAKTTSDYLASLENPPVDATIIYRNGSFQIQSEESGKLANRSLLYSQLRDRIESLSNVPISVSLEEEKPFVATSNVQKAHERVLQLNKQRLVLKYDQDSWVLSGENLLSILEFAAKGLEDGYAAKLAIAQNPVIFRRVTFDSQEEPVLVVKLNIAKLDEFIESIAKTIDRPTQDAQIEFSQGKVVKFAPARDGQKLDSDLVRAQILEKVSIDNPNLEKDIVINLPVAVTRARIANEEINTLGIKELIGKGISYFAGSIANRVYNIGLGAGRISGTIVKPGEVFSYNGAVGEVSGKTGYKQAYVISKGRTVLDDGGGICQVSTTVFRAALSAGLPVVERTAHAYRVGYYEQRGIKPGLDATVWSPAVDFKFKNDTDNHILVQSVFDSSNSRLEIDIYGTSDGRRVEMTTPVVSNVKPAPPDLYQDDPTLPKGSTKQVDFAAAGASSVFARKVFKNNTLIIDEVFKSNYRPWQAIFLVGSGG